MHLFASVAEENRMTVAQLSHVCFHSTLPYFTDLGIGERYHHMFRPRNIFIHPLQVHFRDLRMPGDIGML